MRPPDPIRISACSRGDQHPGHVHEAWDSATEASLEFWCDGRNADGTSPYDPERPGYEPERLPPSQSLDPLGQLDGIAREVKGHVTLHAAYGTAARRHPDPDWSCQIVWATGQPEQPVLSFYGDGPTLPAAVRHVLVQIEAAIAAQTPEEEPPA